MCNHPFLYTYGSPLLGLAPIVLVEVVSCSFKSRKLLCLLTHLSAPRVWPSFAILNLVTEYNSWSWDFLTPSVYRALHQEGGCTLDVKSRTIIDIAKTTSYIQSPNSGLQMMHILLAPSPDRKIREQTQEFSSLQTTGNYFEPRRWAPNHYDNLFHD